MNVPDNWLSICAEELQRGKLTSCQSKFQFAAERCMKDLDEVNAWMSKTRRNFVEMVEEALDNRYKPAITPLDQSADMED